MLTGDFQGIAGRRWSTGSCAVVHQPYFFPWLGYLSKLCFCDIFVVLDNVYFTKRQYLDRTRIIDMHGDVSWLSLPTGQNFNRAICDVVLHPPTVVVSQI